VARLVGGGVKNGGRKGNKCLAQLKQRGGIRERWCFCATLDGKGEEKSEEEKRVCAGVSPGFLASTP